jgi:transposase-like protein
MNAAVKSPCDLFEGFPDEQACIEQLASIRWHNKKSCPLCGSPKVYDFSDRRTFKCGDCRQRFSVKVGTIFEGSKLSLRTWFIAIWMITSHSNKGLTSTSLAKDLNITQKTACFVMRRLRQAARTKSFNAPLKHFVSCFEGCLTH